MTIFKYSIIILGVVGFLSLVSALEITSPTTGTIWDKSTKNIITWTSDSSDPSTIFIGLQSSDPPVSETFETVDTSTGSYVLQLNSLIPNGDGYQVVFYVTDSTNSEVLAQSNDFEIDGQAAAASSAAATTIPSAAATTSSPAAATRSSNAAASSTTQIHVPGAAATTTSHPPSNTTKPPLSLNSKGSESLSTGAKAGIGVVVTIIVLTIVILSLFLWRRRQRHATRTTYTFHPSDHNGKPELQGDQPYGHAEPSIEKHELEAHFTPVVNRNTDPNSTLQPRKQPAELPQANEQNPSATVATTGFLSKFSPHRLTTARNTRSQPAELPAIQIHRKPLEHPSNASQLPAPLTSSTPGPDATPPKDSELEKPKKEQAEIQERIRAAEKWTTN